MMEVPSREEAILEAVLMLPLAQQAQYLDKVCGKDGPERERIEVLLNSRIAATTLGAEVVKPAATIMVTLLPSEQPGDRIGQYKLLQQIGEGGCGVVYMAEQEHPVRRRVALKVIKLGMDTKSVIARFEAER